MEQPWWTVISQMRDYLWDSHKKYTSELQESACAAEIAEVYYDLSEMLEDAVERVISLHPELKPW